MVVTTDERKDLVERISSRLIAQVEAHRKLKFQIQMPFDWPGAIDLKADRTGNDSPVHQQEAVKDLSQHWTVLNDSRDIAQHLSLVAAGMAPRPRRPDREVIFQPFSSRDAHILLQLKRTLDVAGDSPTLSTLLRFALQAGKAARNPDMVPELMELRNEYGTGNSKFDVTPPIDVSRRVADAAQRRAIDPMVQDCVDQLRSMEFGDRIRGFREQAVAYAMDDSEVAYIQKQLHKPTLLLRRGDYLDEAAFLEELSGELAARRVKAQR